MSRPKKKPEPERDPEPTEPEAPAEPVDRWACAECGAPGLTKVFRTKRGPLCWACFFDSPSKEVATFEHRK